MLLTGIYHLAPCWDLRLVSRAPAPRGSQASWGHGTWVLRARVGAALPLRIGSLPVACDELDFSVCLATWIYGFCDLVLNKLILQNHQATYRIFL